MTEEDRERTTGRPVAGDHPDPAEESSEQEEPAEALPASAEPTPDLTPPDVDGFRPRHPNALKAALIVGTIVVAIVAGANLFAATLVVLFAGLPLGWKVFTYSVAVGIPALLTLPLLVLPRLQHRRYRYCADDRGLEIRKGVWWRSHRFIPRTRLQHTDLAQGPLERYLGLASLVVHTAGTHEARTTLSGLSKERARAVRERLTGEADDEADGV